jgi:hypothetical protein
MTNQNKEQIQPGDMMLIYIDHRPGFFARAEELVPDVKNGWWQVRILPIGMDNLDYKTIVWILDEDQIRGGDYTMSGIPMRIEKIPPYCKPEPEVPSKDFITRKPKLVSLVNRRKQET